MFGIISRTVKENVREYILLNLFFYGLVAVSMAYTFVFPEVQRGVMEELRAEFPKMFPIVVDAYTSGNFPFAALLTFLINLVLGSFVYITLPSFIIPFGGIIMGCIRAIGWGVLLAPTSPEMAWSMIPHSLTLILEGQGYILAMFAAYVHWKGVFWPKKVGEEKRSKAYLKGIKNTACIYLLVTLVLAVSALYEAFEVIYLVGIRA